MAQVIEWKNPRPEDVVWRYPIEDITWGAQLIVREYEAAVFFRDGKAYDVFGPGRHTLTTLNLPLLTAVLSRIAGYRETPFKAGMEHEHKPPNWRRYKFTEPSGLRLRIRDSSSWRSWADRTLTQQAT